MGDFFAYALAILFTFLSYWMAGLGFAALEHGDRFRALLFGLLTCLSVVAVFGSLYAFL